MPKIIKPTRRKLASHRSAPIDPFASFTIKWADIYQEDNVVFAKLKGAGIGGCIMRAHFGTDADTKHNEYVAATRAEGLGIGSYGFILPNQNIAEQVAIAVAAVKAVGGYKSGDVRFWADVEGKAWSKIKTATTQTQRHQLRKEWRTAQIDLWQKAAATDNKRMDILLSYLHGIRDGNLPGPDCSFAAQKPPLLGSSL
jgi:hypothetical protein